ncbi:MAG: ribonuclease HII [Candidatus Aenigmarchaeota archaeon]|nr:ribonuclease HII [Candidatus Aenigmarchaeota archaeon]
MVYLLGIDEAGKGPVIGPLIICGCLVKEEDEEKLKILGVKDSKELTPRQREKLSEEIKQVCEDFFIAEITTQQLNSEMGILNLNQIELARVAKIVNNFLEKKPRVVIDSFEANTEKFAQKLRFLLKDKETKIVSENRADKNHPVVGAASILAKVTRDSKIKDLHKTYGDFGSGYPADPRTVNFLGKLEESRFPEIVRLKWSTAERILEARKKRVDQKNLGEY